MTPNPQNPGAVAGEAAIREALAAGPTPGPWMVDQDPRPGMGWNRSIATQDGATWLCTMMHSGGKAPRMDAANADLIAACNPEAMRSLIAELDRLRASQSDGTSGGWQPIETAPKDGTLIVLGARNGVWLGKYVPVYGSGYRPENPWSSMLLNHDHMAERYTRPTHWMPLPAAPTQGENHVG